MTENKDKQSDKDKDSKQTSSNENIADKEPNKDKEQHDRTKKLTQLMDLLTVPGTSKLLTAKRHSHSNVASTSQPQVHAQVQQQNQLSAAASPLSCSGERSPIYRSAHGSFQSEIFLLDVDTGETLELLFERFYSKDEFGTQRVFKKTSPNCVLTLYLPTREITLSGNTSSVLRGIVFVDPKAIQGYRVYAQLTLTFRYGREDEEVMGLRFCNEAIMSLHQIWPRNEDPAPGTLSPLQEALVKRLGEGAHPFTLTLSPQAPPSVQLVPAKRYYGAPIGTSYDVRCFIADKTDDKFHRRASVKMGIRVIYRTNVFHNNINGPENFAALINNQTASPPADMKSPPVAILHADASASTPPIPGSSLSHSMHETHNNGNATVMATTTTTSTTIATATTTTATTVTATPVAGPCTKARKSERGDSFPKLRLSPKSFRFSGRFGRSKSEIEKYPNDPFYNYSKSFQEYDNSCGGPQGAVDKPFLLQDGRVSLRANLDKAWYTHGEDVCVTVNIRNDSRKTVRKVRVCAIQHVDVCMFNNGKFKNIVADSDSHSPIDRTVPPGGTLSSTIVLKPQRGPTKNWIALEDTLQRSTEPDEITGAIAASAIRSPGFVMPTMTQAATSESSSPAVAVPHPPIYFPGANTCSGSTADEDRNVFAIYVSYYVKVKLTLSGMGGELSLKLPFVLVHIDENQRHQRHVGADAMTEDIKMEKLALDDVPSNRKNGNKIKQTVTDPTTEASHANSKIVLDTIESLDDELNIRVPTQRRCSIKPRLIRSETLAKDLDEDIQVENEADTEHLRDERKQDATTVSSSAELENVHVVQVHNMPPPSDSQDMEIVSEPTEVVDDKLNRNDEVQKSCDELSKIVVETLHTEATQESAGTPTKTA